MISTDNQREKVAFSYYFYSLRTLSMNLPGPARRRLARNLKDFV